MSMVTGPFFPSRLDPNYLKILSKHMRLENIKRSALKAENPLDIKNGYSRIILIELAGIAATSILEREHDNFEILLQEIPNLRSAGIKVVIRFLFTYLYSDFCHAQIEAEQNEHRSFINKSNNNENINLYLLTQDAFTHSFTYTYQREALKTIQELYNTHCASHFEFNEVFDIRFSCLPLNFCILNINNAIFFDSYSYAKEKHRGPMSHEMPLVFLRPSTSAQSIAVIKNHFWYIWHHSTTLLCADATECQCIAKTNKIDQLSKIKTPNEITYSHKKQRVKNKALKNKIKISDEVLNSWQFRVKTAFKNMTRVIPYLPKTETIFIGFSFRKFNEINQIRLYLEKDFKNNLQINVVDLSIANGSLYDTLIEQLKGSTMGLFFLARDIKQETIGTTGSEKYHARPNIYFELGYMLCHLERYESPSLKRMRVFMEEKVEVPSDIQDIFRELLTQNLEIYYYHILEHILTNNQTLAKHTAKQAVKNYRARLIKSVQNKKVKVTDLKMISDSHYLNGKTTSSYVDVVCKQLSDIIEKRFHN